MNAETFWISVNFFSGVGPAFFLALVVLSCVLLWYRGVAGALFPFQFRALLALRLVAAVSLLILFFSPGFVITKMGIWSDVPILVDVSESMTTRDTEGGPSRAEQASLLLGSEPGGLLRSIESMGKRRIFSFGESTRELSLEQLRANARIDPVERKTRLAEALGDLKNLGIGSAPGIILVTDGIHNGSQDPVRTASSLGLPVFAIQVGQSRLGSDWEKDIVLSEVECSDAALFGDKISASVSIAGHGFEGTSLPLELYCDGSLCATTEFIVPVGRSVTRVPFVFAPPRPGILSCLVRVAPNAGERSEENNQISFQLEVQEQSIRVLYLEGSIRWEYKFLRRCLDSEPLISATCLIRQSENTFRLVRSSSSETEVSDSFSSADECLADLPKYKVLILGDVDRNAFTTDQLESIREFVSDGGGLVLMGGKHLLGSSAYVGTPLAEVIPVIPSEGNGETIIDKCNDLSLTFEGEVHPILTGLASFFKGTQESPFASLEGANRVQSARPGASVLLTCGQNDDPLPLLTVMNYGSGRSIALTTDSTWKWAFAMPASGHQTPYGRFWGQLIRWSASQEFEASRSDRRVQVSADKPQYFTNEVALVKVVVKGEYGEAIPNVTVEAELRSGSPNEKPVPITLHISDNDPTLYEGSLLLEVGGDFLLSGAAYVRKALALDTDEVPIHVSEPKEEMAELQPNEELLRKIAEVSGGRYYEYKEALSLLGELERRVENTLLTRERTLGPPWLWFVLFTMLCGTEWYLRRRRNLL